MNYLNDLLKSSIIKTDAAANGAQIEHLFWTGEIQYLLYYVIH